ncbi:biotin--[acetyl-CoA-carboxylase] ligase [Pasteuria penetrans]|uniref:biotin--[acetyl-CoA-carboxylase] ligase n=1 Tax=Pasteuria penetrans TaxID=86005 RepID=UPI000FC2BEA1|nr:biotin--[acetyl-CoA-carboxylase] ligase [Pasteuria penetrans]
MIIPSDEDRDLAGFAVLSRLSTRWLGRNYFHYSVTTSTQDEVFRRAKRGQGEGLVVTADRQISGRGQHGRIWHTFPQTSLSFSFCLPRGCLTTGAQPLPYRVSRIVSATIGTCIGKSPDVVFPNDVTLAGKKVAGILVEVRDQWAIVGIGINVNTPEKDFPSPLSTRATSLSEMNGKGCSRRVLFLQLLSNLERDLYSLAGGESYG